MKVSLELGAIPREMVHREHAAIARAQRAAVEEGAAYFAGKLAQNTPKGATGKARQSVTWDFQPSIGDAVRGLVYYMEPPGSYIAFPDQGTRPHFPPIAPIRYWAQRVLGDASLAYPIALAIAKRGTKAQRFLERTFAQEEGATVKIMQNAAARSLAYWAG